MTSWPGAAVAGGAGLLIGGYVPVLIQRVPAARTISGSLRELTRRPLGECPHCAAGRPAADLVPLLGWARTGSVCRDCGERPGAWRPAAELLTAALSALETALGHDPYNEYLYVRIMRLQAAAGRPEAVRRTLSLLEARLTDLGITPGAQTRQIAASLLGTGPAPHRRAEPG